MLNSTQQFFQQIPVITSSNLLTLLSESNQSRSQDPLADIRNGLYMIDLFFHRKKRIIIHEIFLARLKIGSVWRRSLAEVIDFILLHIFKY